ncbi:hypothetical protein LINPERPRIM_LOCUS25024 [Linum perenne]
MKLCNGSWIKGSIQENERDYKPVFCCHGRWKPIKHILVDEGRVETEDGNFSFLDLLPPPVFLLLGFPKSSIESLSFPGLCNFLSDINLSQSLFQSMPTMEALMETRSSAVKRSTE